MTGSVNVHGSTGVDLKRVEKIANEAKNAASATTKEQLGLGNVDNTSDADKPVSTAQQAALDTKANLSDFNAHTGNADVHITAEERSEWNGKANGEHTHGIEDIYFTRTNTALGMAADAAQNNASAVGFAANAADDATALGHLARAAGNNSIAVGKNSKASGNWSLAIGSDATVNSAHDCTAIGFNAVCSGLSSVAIGTSAVAVSGSDVALGQLAQIPEMAGYAVALGREALAGAFFTIALGMQSSSTANNAMALGKNANTSGESAIAIGHDANAAYIDALALGHNAAAASKNSIAIGCKAQANGIGSIALGDTAHATNSYSMALGHYTTADEFSLALGSTAHASGLNAMAIGGLTSAAGNYSTALGYYASTSNDNSIQLGNASSLSSITARVSITVTSDERNKANITPIDDGAIDFLRKIKAIRFFWNGRTMYLPDEKDRTDEDKENLTKYGICRYDKEAHAAGTKKGSRVRVGVLAQEVQKALKEVYGDSSYGNLVNDNFFDFDPADIPDGIESQLGVNYENFVPFLIKAIQELDQRLAIRPVRKPNVGSYKCHRSRRHEVQNVCAYYDNVRKGFETF